VAYVPFSHHEGVADEIDFRDKLISAAGSLAERDARRAIRTGVPVPATVEAAPLEAVPVEWQADLTGR
jgi:hypothetical protein